MEGRRNKTMDGNTAAAYVSYAFTEVAAIYPITPSSPMAGLVDEWASKGRKNIFGQPVLVKEMQSEGGAAGTLHGALQGGSLATTYTASQGLLLMIPNMYKIAGELLPCVFHVSARSLSSNSLSIFGDHQDVMSTRQTGFALLASSNVQQCMDLGAVAHLAAIDSRIPFLHFFDGFRTSHEIQKINVLEYDELKKLVNWDAINAFRKRALNPDHPVLRGATVNPDIFFQLRESVNTFYSDVPKKVQTYMDKINELTGSNYKLFNYYGDPEVERVIVCMGSGCDTIKETIDYALGLGEKVGLLEVHLYRPFSTEHFLREIPSTVKKIAVLDRTKEPGASGDPLYLDVLSAYYGRKNPPVIVGGRYGLASKDFVPADVMAVFENLKSESPRDKFTVSILDDVTHTSLPAYDTDLDTTPKGTIACKFWGLGSDGTVSANQSAIKIIGDHTDMFVQAYFEFDAKKSGGLTVSHLRFSKSPIKSSYLINKADFISCNNQSYVNKYDLLEGIKSGGKFLLNCIWTKEELERNLPGNIKREIARNKVQFYTINAVDIARQIGLGGRINMVMQAAFFKLTELLSENDAKKYLKDQVEKSYGKQGQAVIDMNNRAIDLGFESLVRIDYPESWQDIEDKPAELPQDMPDFVKNVILPMNRQQGDKLPVSVFKGREDGTFPTGISQWEKRAVAIDVPLWDKDKCLQCNHCSFVCSHAVIRPLLLDEESMKNAPEGLAVKDAIGFPGKKFHLAISALDCTGCENCVMVCPAKEKALEMKPLSLYRDKYEREWSFASSVENAGLSYKQKFTVKGSQFMKPYIEFSGACPGCGETPYAKLVTQLFGDRMMVSNSAGCSTVWGGSPQVSYTKDSKGFGPSWGFSLFEDNAEYGYGLMLGANNVRNWLKGKVRLALESDIAPELREAMEEWLEGFSKSEGTRDRADKLSNALKDFYKGNTLLTEIYNRRDYFVKRSCWVFGGDGWAYDIGYGGLDHVLAQGDDINILVFDTEVYSNTGGQSSKSTPTAAIAEFASGGKKVRKKDLGLMAMSYGYVYVAQIAMGADKAHTLKAIQEAESYPGPSLIIAYSPCINHGIKGGMKQAQMQQKRAVECGYWSLYRFDPRKKEQGKNPFSLDSKDPAGSFKDFLLSEVRYAALYKQFPQKACELFDKAQKDALDRLETYKRLAKGTV